MELASTHQTFSQSLLSPQVVHKRLEVRQDCWGKSCLRYRCNKASFLRWDAGQESWEKTLWGIQAALTRRAKASALWRAGGRAAGKRNISQGSEIWGIKQDAEQTIGHYGMREMFFILFWVVFTWVYKIVKMHCNEYVCKNYAFYDMPWFNLKKKKESNVKNKYLTDPFNHLLRRDWRLDFWNLVFPFESC